MSTSSKLTFPEHRCDGCKQLITTCIALQRHVKNENYKEDCKNNWNKTKCVYRNILANANFKYIDIWLKSDKYRCDNDLILYLDKCIDFENAFAKIQAEINTIVKIIIDRRGVIFGGFNRDYLIYNNPIVSKKCDELTGTKFFTSVYETNGCETNGCETSVYETSGCETSVYGRKFRDFKDFDICVANKFQLETIISSFKTMGYKWLSDPEIKSSIVEFEAIKGNLLKDGFTFLFDIVICDDRTKLVKDFSCNLLEYGYPLPECENPDLWGSPRRLSTEGGGGEFILTTRGILTDLTRGITYKLPTFVRGKYDDNQKHNTRLIRLSKQYEIKDWTSLFPIITNTHTQNKLNKYTLDFVGNHFFGKGKHDVTTCESKELYDEFEIVDEIKQETIVVDKNLQEAINKVNEWIKTGNVNKELDLSYMRLTSLPALPKNLQKLWCYNNQLTSLPDLPNTLEELGCSYNNLTSLPTLPNTLQILDCSYNNLTSLPTLPNTLQILDCSGNKLTSLRLPHNLQELICWNNELTSLPDLPHTLQRLYCTSNKLTSLPNLPNSLRILYCDKHVEISFTPPTCEINHQQIELKQPENIVVDKNSQEAINRINEWIKAGDVNKLLNLSFLNLTSLPPLPNTLQKLYCHNNKLTSLPHLPNSLQELVCSYNKLTSLPPLPNTLQKLYCSNNQLTSLPNLPKGLQTLSCYNNQLTSLPDLPNNLQKLYCHNNKLTSLPHLPNSLQKLICGSNQLTSLPDLPNSLQTLSCYNNQLTSLPPLPNSLQVLHCVNNQLTSLPHLPNNLQKLWCDQYMVSYFDRPPTCEINGFNPKSSIGLQENIVSKVKPEQIKTIEKTINGNNGITILRKTFVNDCITTEEQFYDDGKPKATYVYNHQKQLHGTQRGYYKITPSDLSDFYKDGSVKFQHEYVNGKRDGRQLDYDEHGKLIESVYKDGEEIKSNKYSTLLNNYPNVIDNHPNILVFTTLDEWNLFIDFIKSITTLTDLSKLSLFSVEVGYRTEFKRLLTEQFKKLLNDIKQPTPDDVKHIQTIVLAI